MGRKFICAGGADFSLKYGSEERYQKNKIKYLFQGNSTKLKHWFDCDIEWVKENVITKDTQF